MPLPVENLSAQSTEEEIRTALSESIAQCIREGRSREQCAAIAYNYARERTGKGSFQLGLTEAGG